MSSSDISNCKSQQLNNICSNIKLENVEINKKEYKDIEIKKYAKNLNEKVLKFKIFQKNNIIFFDEITKDCAENEEKEKELADKYKIIFKRDENNEKGIIYEISTLNKDWNFSRHMKNIMNRIFRARFYKRVNIKNLDHVYRMKWSQKQVQFEKIQATPRYIYNNNFFVKIGNKMVFIKNKGKFKKNLNFNRNFKNFNRNFKNFKYNKNFKFNNNKNNNQNLLGNLSNENNVNNNNRNNNNNGRNNRNNNNKRNQRNYYNNNNQFNMRKRSGNNRRFNKNRFNNRRRNTINQRIVFVPKVINSNRNQNF